MTATAQAEQSDYYRAAHAKAKATIRVLPREIAWAVNTQLSDGVEYPHFVDKARWRRLIDEINNLPEPATMETP